MIIYWSMILWVPIIYFFYTANNKEAVKLTDYNINWGIQYKIPMSYAIVVFAYLIFWIGMRTYVADTSAYINTFNNISSDFSYGWSQIDWDGKRPGFDIFNLFFKCFISQNSQWWLMCIAIVSGLCVMSVLRRYSVDFFYSSFLFMTLLTFTWMMNGMRQFICVSILFACCNWIKEGRIVKFIIVVLLLSTVHLTAIMMIPIYFVVRAEPWSRRIALFIAAIILICIFSEPFFSGVDSALGNTAYASATSQFEEDDGVNPLRVLFYAIPPIIAFWKRDEIKLYYDKLPLLKISINMSLAAFCLYLVGMFTSGILIGRLPVYCDIYNLLLIPYLFHTAFKGTDRKILIILYTILLLIYFYFNIRGMNYVSDLTGTI